MKLCTILFCAFIFILPFTGCKNRYEKKINNVLSRIEDKYAPDKRVALFEVKFITGDSPEVIGETSLADAFDELDSILKTDFPEIECKVDLLPSESLDSLIYGLITVSVANLRPIPRHSAELITQGILGTPVHILKKENNWYLIQTPDSYLGWTTESSVSLCTENELKNYNHSDRIIYTDLTGTCYTLPDEDSRPVSDMVAGSILKAIERNEGFWQVQFPDGRTGFVNSDHCQLLQKWQESLNSDQEKIVETAIRFLGLPYLWGGTSSKGVDCSGFTKTVYFMNGIILQRDASQQVLYGDPVDASESYIHLEPADLLFFGVHETDSTREKVTHVGIYIGNGEIIHSSGLVRINSLIPGTENYNDNLNTIFIRARRILTCVGKPGIEPVFSNTLYQY
jgi:cell wall-associated NlpC family hydrolase